MLTAILRGAAAGAAGTTALNAITYLDMAVRGRPSSDTPQQLVATVAEKTGIQIPGDDNTRTNRLQGLGPVFGIGVGVAVGAGAGVVDHLLRRAGHDLPGPVRVLLLAATAMALSDVPLKALGISDPGSWAAQDWAADIIPHLAYGATTLMTLKSFQ